MIFHIDNILMQKTKMIIWLKDIFLVNSCLFNLNIYQLFGDVLIPDIWDYNFFCLVFISPEYKIIVEGEKSK